jgi:HSP20 family protein
MKRSLIPWGDDVSQSISALRHEMDTLFDRFFRESSWSDTSPPNANVAETEHEYEVTLDLPGMKPDDIDIELEPGQLRIRGEKQQEQEPSGKKYHRVERFRGNFERVIPLAAAVDDDRVSAEYTYGVLKITIPKSDKSRARKISVK